MPYDWINSIFSFNLDIHDGTPVVGVRGADMPIVRAVRSVFRPATDPRGKNAQVAAFKNASGAGSARCEKVAVLHQGATLTNSRKNAWHDADHRATFSQDLQFGLDCAPLVGNASLSKHDAISTRD